MKRMFVRAAFAAALASAATGANATVLAFSGSMTGLGVTSLDSTCAPYPARGTIDGALGSSSLGGFTYSHDICLDGAPGTSAGTFEIDFGAGSILGTLTGTATPSGTPMVGDTLFNYLITGGTGAFLGASGTFTGTGTADTNFMPAHVAIAFDGSIDAPAVPEPGTWAMMLLGFGAIGASLRRRRSVAAAPRLRSA